MVGIYFGGSGNTKHCVEYFIKLWDDWTKAFSIEDKAVVWEVIKNDIIIFGYSVQFYKDALADIGN